MHIDTCCYANYELFTEHTVTYSTQHYIFALATGTCLKLIFRAAGESAAQIFRSCALHF